MNGKVCLITGASAGIGYSTALGIAKLGATTILASKNKQRGKEAEKYIIEQSNNKNVELLFVDLASISSIREFADKFNSKYHKLDVLINNAGVLYSNLVFTEDNIEMQFGINHLAPFLLTNLFMELLKEAKDSRIINVTSRFHFRGKIHFDDLSLLNKYHGLRAYCQSKLANVLFTYKLAEKLKNSDITVNCLHPGTAKTKIGITNSTGWYPVMCNIIKPFLISSQKAARTSIYLASSEEVKGVTGKYFQKCKAVKSSKLSYNKKIADQLWNVSEELTGIKYL